MKIKLYFLISSCFCLGCTNNSRVVYRLPENFDGFFAVVYNHRIDSSVPTKRTKLVFDVTPPFIIFSPNRFIDEPFDEFFLIKNPNGYDTLKTYLAIHELDSARFDLNFFESHYTSDTGRIALNNRRLVNTSFNIPSESNEKSSECYFEYELFSIGRASTLKDSIGQIFIKNLELYLRNMCK